MQQALDLKKKIIKKAKKAYAKSKQTLLACNITKNSFKKKKINSYNRGFDFTCIDENFLIIICHHQSSSYKERIRAFYKSSSMGSYNHTEKSTS